MTVQELEKFKKYHRYGEIKFAIAELQKLISILREEIEDCKVLLDPIDYEDYHQLLGVARGYKNVIDYICQQIDILKAKLNENKD